MTVWFSKSLLPFIEREIIFVLTSKPEKEKKKQPTKQTKNCVCSSSRHSKNILIILIFAF